MKPTAFPQPFTAPLLPCSLLQQRHHWFSDLTPTAMFATCECNKSRIKFSMAACSMALQAGPEAELLVLVLAAVQQRTTIFPDPQAPHAPLDKCM